MLVVRYHKVSSSSSEDHQKSVDEGEDEYVHFVAGSVLYILHDSLLVQWCQLPLVLLDHMWIPHLSPIQVDNKLFYHVYW